jgi:hypothetical protein
MGHVDMGRWDWCRRDLLNRNAKLLSAWVRLGMVIDRGRIRLRGHLVQKWVGGGDVSLRGLRVRVWVGSDVWLRGLRIRVWVGGDDVSVRFPGRGVWVGRRQDLVW